MDSDISMQVYYIEADTTFGNNTSDSTDNPLLLYVGQLLQLNVGTLTSIEDIDFTGQQIPDSLKGKEIGIYYPISDEHDEYVFSRVYHNGNSLLIFYIAAPDYRINDLITLKNSFFETISMVY